MLGLSDLGVLSLIGLAAGIVGGTSRMIRDWIDHERLRAWGKSRRVSRKEVESKKHLKGKPYSEDSGGNPN